MSVFSVRVPVLRGNQIAPAMLNTRFLKSLICASALAGATHLGAQGLGPGTLEPQLPDAPAQATDRLALEPPEQGAWSLIVAPVVYHWLPSPEHRNAIAVAVERRNKAESSLGGLSLFRNSFGQPSAYAYWGKYWDNVWGNPDLSFKLTAGLLYGYVGKFKDRVPLNYNGFAPCVIPVLLYHLDRNQSFDLMVLGVGGVGFSYTHNF